MGSGIDRVAMEVALVVVAVAMEMVAVETVGGATEAAATDAAAAATAVAEMAVVALACSPRMRAGACQQRVKTLSLSRERSFVNDMSCTHLWLGE